MENRNPAVQARSDDGHGETGPGQTAFSGDHAVILFDGVCNLCNALVNFMIDRDPHGVFRFAPLQSQTGQDIMRQHGLATDELDTFVLVEGERAYTRSTAVLRTLRRLRGGWALLYALITIPAPVRDAVYRLIARRRYGWFGQSPTCRIPTPDIRDRLLT